jgi:hypothetical protein
MLLDLDRGGWTTTRRRLAALATTPGWRCCRRHRLATTATATAAGRESDRTRLGDAYDRKVLL